MGQIIDTGLATGNLSSHAITLGPLSFAHGFSSHLRLIHTGLVTGIRYSYAQAGYGWPPRGVAAMHGKQLQTVRGYRLGPHRYVAIFAAFKPTQPGIYYMPSPTVRAKRTDFWQHIPGVGGDWVHTYSGSDQSFCVGVPEDLCTDAGDILDSGTLPNSVLSIRWFLKHVGSVADKDRSGYFLVERPGNRVFKVWFTIKNGRGSYRSRPMDVGKGWQLSADAGMRCRRPVPSDNAITMRVSTMRPDGSDRHRWTRLPNGDSTSGAGSPVIGPIEVVVKDRCSWTVYAYSTGGRISL